MLSLSLLLFNLRRLPNRTRQFSRIIRVILGNLKRQGDFEKEEKEEKGGWWGGNSSQLAKHFFSLLVFCIPQIYTLKSEIINCITTQSSRVASLLFKNMVIPTIIGNNFSFYVHAMLFKNRYSRSPCDQILYFWEKKVLIYKQKKNLGTGAVVQVIRHLPCT